MKKPRNDAVATRKIQKLTFPDGFRAGILNLDSILKEVVELNLTNPEAIKLELLKRVKSCNYVPSSAESEYSAALFLEYQRKIGAVKDRDKTEIHKHSAG